METNASPDNAVDPSLPIDERGFVSGDVPCVRCGYNLRTLHRDAVCPECAAPVEAAISGQFLQYCDPTWIESLARGMNWILVSVLAIVLGPVGGYVLDVTFYTAARTPSLSFTWMAVTLASISGLIGWWLLTRPEPRIIHGETCVTARRIARASALITTIPLACCILPGALSWVSEFLPLSILSGIVQITATLCYLRQLSLRIPNKDMAYGTSMIMRGFVLTAGGSALMFAVGAMSSSWLSWVCAFAMLWCFGSAAISVIFEVCVLILFVNYRTAFILAANRARAFGETAT